MVNIGGELEPVEEKGVVLEFILPFWGVVLHMFGSLPVRHHWRTLPKTSTTINKMLGVHSLQPQQMEVNGFGHLVKLFVTSTYFCISLTDGASIVISIV